MPNQTSPEVGEGEPERLRLQLWLARAGVSSRRQAERLIEEGRVSVNGTIISEPGTKAAVSDDVRLDGRRLALETRLVYFLLNKPAGFLSSMSDPEGRRLAIDLLGAEVKERVYNVGRLDQWSSGLLLFTNDGNLARALSHPSSGIEKEYEVLSDQSLPPEFFREFARGVTIDETRFRAASIVPVDERRTRIVLVEGKNREIRRVLEHYGRKALSLCRVRIGPLTVDGLAEGKYRELNMAEVEALKSAIHTSRTE
jgi:23S rRNA pseudouridine2605 synthase